jgi:hypothetical protein
MELDDLKAAWADLDKRVEGVETIVRADYRARRMSRARRALGWLGLGQVVQVAIALAIVVTVAPFWIAHRHIPHLLLAGLLLHAYGVFTISAAVVQLLVIGRTYYTGPIVQCQKRLAELRRLRIICELAVGLPWLVLWVPALLVIAQVFAGVDLYARVPGWILGNVAFGLLAIVSSVWVARWLANRPTRPRCVQSLLDDLAGRSLQRVAANLAEIRAFETGR